MLIELFVCRSSWYLNVSVLATTIEKRTQKFIDRF